MEYSTVVDMNQLAIYNNMDSTIMFSRGKNSQKNMCSNIPFIFSSKACKIKEYIV